RAVPAVLRRRRRRTGRRRLRIPGKRAASDAPLRALASRLASAERISPPHFPRRRTTPERALADLVPPGSQGRRAGALGTRALAGRRERQCGRNAIRQAQPAERRASGETLDS